MTLGIKHSVEWRLTLTLDIQCRYAECRYAKCHYAECHYAECCYAERRYAKCHYAECRYAKCHYAERRFAECRSVEPLEATSSIFAVQTHLQIKFAYAWNEKEEIIGQFYKTFYGLNYVAIGVTQSKS